MSALDDYKAFLERKKHQNGENGVLTPPEFGNILRKTCDNRDNRAEFGNILRKTCDNRDNRQITDERISCWGCQHWISSGKCINPPFNKTHAIANGTLIRCFGFLKRISPMASDIGFCVVCGCQVATTHYQFYPCDELPSSLYCNKHHPVYSQIKATI